MPGTRRQLDENLGALLARRKSRGKLRKLSNTPFGCVDFSSNGYLSLSTNPIVQKSLLACLAAQVSASEDSKKVKETAKSRQTGPVAGRMAAARSLHGAPAGMACETASCEQPHRHTKRPACCVFFTFVSE